ncbi:MAG: permease [Bacilli bacterium]
MNFIENIFLKMTWLYSWSEYLVTDIFGLSMNSKLGGGLQFFIYGTIKIFLLLGFLIFSISYIQSYFPPERTKKILGRFKGVTGNTLGALLGTITPFCSCSSIPLFIGFTSAGLPLGITFSFLISSPLVDLASFLLLSSFFGFKIAAIYVIVGIILAVVGGVIIDKMNMIKHVEEYILNIENVDTEIQTMSMKERIHFSKGQVKEIFDKVWFPILIGVGIGALIHNVIPRETIEMLLGKDNPFAVIIATVIGIPMYADIFGTLPIAEALYMKGVGLGTILALMMSVTALSFPSIVMLSKVVKPKLLGLYIGLVSIGIVIIGYLFNAITL